MQKTDSRRLAACAVLCASLYQAGLGDDYPQWGRSGSRNNVSSERGLATEWAAGKFERKTGKWNSKEARNIKWVADLGWQTFGTPVIADGRVFVGTNNGRAYLKRYPDDVDLGCLLCFRERDGQFLWQFSAEKLPEGRVHDWPLMGIASSPLVEKDRAWFVSNRGEVVCLDTQGFYDEEDDGPVVAEEAKLFEWWLGDDAESRKVLQEAIANLDRGELPARARDLIEKAGEPLPAKVDLRVDQPGKRWSFQATVADLPREYHLNLLGPHLQAFKRMLPADQREADVVWRFDMMKELGSQQHNLATCCITSWKDTLFICTGNGVDDAHIAVPAPEAPSFFAMDKHTGKVLWTSNLPGANIQHGQWSAPAVGLLGGVPQVIFCGGDGWVYSFHAEQWNDGRPRLLWKFDTNAKDAVLSSGGQGTRNEPIAPPVLFDNKVFVTTGQDPEHGEGAGCIWCIDATKALDGRDVSPHKVLDGRGNVLPHRRITNSPTWQEARLVGGDLGKALDRGIIEKNFRDQFKYQLGALPETVVVKAVTPGSEWELTAGTGDSRETMYLWKRWRINEQGERDHIYVGARRNGSRIVDNADSAAVWKYDKFDWNGNGKIDDYYEEMHRAISSVVIHNDLLFCPDYSGYLHCLDVKTGKRHWVSDHLASSWSTPLVADGRLFACDEDGDVAVFHLSADPAKAGILTKPQPEEMDFYQTVNPFLEINMQGSICCNPVAANGVLYIATKEHLFAIETKKP